MTISGLYVITPSCKQPDSAYFENIEKVVALGIGALQYRDKLANSETKLDTASRLKEITDRYHTPLIINNDVTLAETVHAAGVHVGQDDMPVNEARTRLGDKAIIGASCYGSIQRAHQMIHQGASYLAFGSIYHSGTKPKAFAVGTAILEEAARTFQVSIVAIGGITSENVAQVKEAGASAFAVIGNIFNSKEPECAAAKLLQALNK